jgi:hypothetical protein
MAARVHGSWRASMNSNARLHMCLVKVRKDLPCAPTHGRNRVQSAIVELVRWRARHDRVSPRPGVRALAPWCPRLLRAHNGAGKSRKARRRVCRNASLAGEW